MHPSGDLFVEVKIGESLVSGLGVDDTLAKIIQTPFADEAKNRIVDTFRVQGL
jgi:hypothetical protein